MFYEKRNFFRMKVDIPARILNIPDESNQKPRLLRGIIRDLSGGGLRIEGDSSFSVKNQVKLSFALPFNEADMMFQKFFLSGEVIRSNKTLKKGLLEYGVKFINILPNIQDRIVKFLFDLQISSKMEVKSK